MYNNVGNYAPFFSEGLLFLPQQTVEMLIKAGMDQRRAEAALYGLALDDDHELIGQISNTLERVLESLTTGDPAFDQLSTVEARFMLDSTALAS